MWRAQRVTFEQRTAFGEGVNVGFMERSSSERDPTPRG